MADVTGATKPEDEIITKPKDGDSLADDLDNRREVTGDMLMGGHPNEDLEEGGEFTQGGEGGEEPKPGEAKPGEAAGGEPEKKKEEPKFRFKSQEEAERAHGEAERLMTTRAQEAADLRRELEELKAKQGEKPPEKKEEEPVKKPSNEELDAELERVATAANREALKLIDELDATDPDYEDKRAAIWAKANAKIIREATKAQAPMSQADIDQIVEKRLEARDVAAKEAKAKTDAATAAQKAAKEVEDYCKEQGLPVDDPERAEYDLFDAAERKLPQELRGKGATPEVKEWIANYIRTRTGKVALSEVEKEEAARQEVINNQPLGKGGVKPKPKQPMQESEGSLAEDFAEARGRRVI